MYQVNYNGLKKRDTYDEIVNYIETDKTKIKYPNRTATFTAQSPYLKMLGGVDYEAMTSQQNNMLNAQNMMNTLRAQSIASGGTHIVNRATSAGPTPGVRGGGGGIEPPFGDGREEALGFLQGVDDASARAAEARRQRLLDESGRSLSTISEASPAHQIASGRIRGDADASQATRGIVTTSGLDLPSGETTIDQSFLDRQLTQDEIDIIINKIRDATNIDITQDYINHYGVTNDELEMLYYVMVKLKDGKYKQKGVTLVLNKLRTLDNENFFMKLKQMRDKYGIPEVERPAARQPQEGGSSGSALPSGHRIIGGATFIPLDEIPDSMRDKPRLKELVKRIPEAHNLNYHSWFVGGIPIQHSAANITQLTQRYTYLMSL